VEKKTRGGHEARKPQKICVRLKERSQAEKKGDGRKKSERPARLRQ